MELAGHVYKHVVCIMFKPTGDKKQTNKKPLLDNALEFGKDKIHPLLQKLNNKCPN